MLKDTNFKIGLDVGSTTIKCMVFKEQNIIFKSYERHKAMIKEKAIELLSYINENILENAPAYISVTGSSGLGLSQDANIKFVQEVYATKIAARKYYPNIDVIIELGGEDAKILFLSGAPEVRMNGSCAGGTGAFIDQMAVLLGIDLKEFDELSLNYDKLYTIASRCGVFAKSDIQPLINQSARKNDLTASIFQAVVNQTISGLAQGREIKGMVMFLGGPLTFFKGLRERFVDSLNLSEKDAIFPENSQYFVALGAAEYAFETAKPVKLSSMIESLKTQKKSDSKLALPPLFNSESEYEEFLSRQNKIVVNFTDISDYSGNAYLGIDAGSTTIKIVLISEDNKILYSKYLSNGGEVLDIVIESLKEIYNKISSNGNKIKITGSAVTGYGEDLIKSAFYLDYGIVETVAHFTSARYFLPNVDFIIDIGGQDIKCFKLKMGAIDSIMLNEACSSGCGSFLETFATSLGYTAPEFAKKGLFAKSPVDLGSRCTVFMNSSVKQAQKEGATIEDISAGLSISIVKNAIYKVIRAQSPNDLGTNVVVQGGTFLNDAVLRAFEREIGVNVIRTPISGLMGAYGCALYAKDNISKPSSTITPEVLEKFSHSVKSTTCKNCPNNCRLTINNFGNKNIFISGNKCNKYNNVSNSIKYNMIEYTYNRLVNLPSGKGSRGKIGIPMVLNMFENLPFWVAFFESLNFEVVISPRSSRKLYISGQHTIPSDTVCYPAKLVHGHISALINKDVDLIFYPCMTYNFDEHSGDNNYNCPVVAYYPEIIKSNMTFNKKQRFIMDYIGIDKPKYFEKFAFKIFSKYFDVEKKEIKFATNKAYSAYKKYKLDLKNYTSEAINYANQNNKQIIVLACRPYHIDPEINHGIDRLLSSYDTVVLTSDAISYQVDYKVKTNVLNQWTYHARLYTAAKEITKHKNMNLIQLVSFGCGVDAITTDEVRDILEQNNKLYTQIKIDEINNLGATKIRIRSLLAAIEERNNY